MSYLILFDIDGTLLRCGPRLREIFEGALADVRMPAVGVPGYDFAGKIDPVIVRDLGRAAGWTLERSVAAIPEVRSAWVRRLEAELAADEIEIMPGVSTLLERLAARPDVELGLLTGNWQAGAAVKLRRAGLDHHFAFGAFGDDGEHRRDLPPVALARAAEIHRREYEADCVWIVGDTVHDVDCARANGLPCLGVATGGSTVERLRQAGAVQALEDFTHLAADWPFASASVNGWKT
ncbi:MAG: HAD family hydrolase [Acidobacteriota bacterium]